MEDIIVISDDEDATSLPPQDVQPSQTEPQWPSLPEDLKQTTRKRWRLVLVDSRRCHRMPRPKFLPIESSAQANAGIRTLESQHDKTNASGSTEVREPTAAFGDDAEEDPDYEDVRPVKRRRGGVKGLAKKHGRLSAPDWEVVRNGNGNGNGGANLAQRTIGYGAAVSDRKEARDYVKRLIAQVDWENILRSLEKMKPNAAGDVAGQKDRDGVRGRQQRALSPANRLKQFWQTVLTKSLLKMDAK